MYRLKILLSRQLGGKQQCCWLGSCSTDSAVFDSCFRGKRGKGGQGRAPTSFHECCESVTVAVSGILPYQVGGLYLSGAMHFVCLRFAHCLLGLACLSPMLCHIPIASAALQALNMHRDAAQEGHAEAHDAVLASLQCMQRSSFLAS